MRSQRGGTARRRLRGTTHPRRSPTTTTRRCERRAIAIALCLALASPGALAQPPPDAGDAAYRDGRQLYDLREWDRAIEKFKQSYELRHDAASLFNIAQSYRLKGDCVEALGFYKTYARNYPGAPNLDKVRRFMTELEPCANARPAPSVAAESPPAPDETVVQHDEAPPPPVKRASSRRVAGWAVLASGGAALGGSFIAGALARAKWSDALTHCDASHACDSRGLVLGDQARTRATVATVLGGVGLSAVAAGAILLAITPRTMLSPFSAFRPPAIFPRDA